MIEWLLSFAHKHAISLVFGVLVVLIVFGGRYLHTRSVQRSASLSRSSDTGITPDGGSSPRRSRGGTHGPGGGPDE
jgi:hypothetical protein